MTGHFLAKVLRRGIVDTAAYRYRVRYYSDRVTIERLPLQLLGTTAAIDGWAVVKVIQ